MAVKNHVPVKGYAIMATLVVIVGVGFLVRNVLAQKSAGNTREVLQSQLVAYTHVKPGMSLKDTRSAVEALGGKENTSKLSSECADGSPCEVHVWDLPAGRDHQIGVGFRNDRAVEGTETLHADNSNAGVTAEINGTISAWGADGKDN